MMRNGFVAIASVLLALPYLFADIGPGEGSQDILLLFNRAEFVGQGSVKAIKVMNREVKGTTKPITVKTEEATVHLGAIYKGSPTTSIRVVFQVEEPAMSASMPSLSVCESALLFLKKKSDGTYRFSDPFWGKLRMPKTTPSGDTTPGLTRLQHDLAGSLNGEVLSIRDSLR